MDWIKLHRKSAQSEVFADADLWRLWCWLLMRAAFKKNHISIVAGGGRTTATINPGECITGRKAGAEALDWSPSTFERRLKKLAAMQMIEIDPQNHYSIIKILNWQKYQVEQAVDQIEQGSNAGFDGIGEQGANRVRTGCEQGANTNKNEKKDKKDKNYSLSPSRELSKHWVNEEFQTVWFSWLSHVAAKGSPITEPTEQVMLYELGRFDTVEAIEVVRFSILKQCKNLILNGDHKAKPPTDSRPMHGSGIRRKVPSFEEGLL